MAEDFGKQFHNMAESLGNAAKGFMGKLDHFTFKMLIDNLKSNDQQVVFDTIEQLEKEKRPISIAPLFLVAKNHPGANVRKRAEKALSEMTDAAKLEQITAGKSIEEAVKALIQEYGHYKA